MSIFEVILIGVALAMDAFAVTVANCTTYKNGLNKVKEWGMPVTFSVFQILMPILGCFIGSVFSEYVKNVAGYITAGVFFVLALKIVIDNVFKKPDGDKTEDKNFTFLLLLIQGIVTSIDAFFIGVTFSVKLTFSLFLAAGIIGAVTFTIVTLALFIGKSLGKVLGKYAEWAGAIILFALSIKNLVETIIG